MTFTFSLDVHFPAQSLDNKPILLTVFFCFKLGMMDCQCIRGKGHNFQVRKDLKRAAGRVVLKFCLTGELVKELKNTGS